MRPVNRERQERIESIFHTARELAPPDRDRYVDEQCGQDEDLKEAIRSLLAHHAPAERVFKPPEVLEEPAPQQIGPFRITQTLGEGGMGTVYLAEQATPIQRQVAIKVIKPGMDSRLVLSRFQAEQQALAVLDHPSVANVYDAGSTESGRPYFVMEFVSGVSITTYCDENNLDLHARIDIFLEVCSAIQHAHQKGIIHRDIKPGNVIVTEVNGKPLPKVIDFGIAKATETGDLPMTTATRAGQLVGTLEYMSPEQAAALDVDTRTDVYALGLLLYELLAGVPPFDSRSLQERGLEAMLRFIRDSEPPRPSTRLSTLGDSARQTAERRGTETRSLVRELRGDLDWITLKALEKDRERRYASAAELADDLHRYLRHEPIKARPPSTLYRAVKFSRRHRLGVSIAGLVAVSLIAITVIVTWQSARVARERDRAEYEGRVSREVASYLGNMFHESAVASGYPDSVRLVDAMSRGIKGLDGADLTPEARIRILRVYADAYSSMTWLETGRPVVDRLVQLSLDHYGEEHIETAQSRFLLVKLLKQLGVLHEAVQVAELVLPVFERELGAESEETLRCLWYLAGALRNLEQGDRAILLFERLERAYLKTLGPEHPRVGILYNEMSFPLALAGRFAEAEHYARRSVEIMEAKYGEDSFLLSLSLDALSAAHMRAGRYEEATSVLERVERMVRESYGDDHPEMKRLKGRRGWILFENARYEDARLAFEEAVMVPANVPEHHVADPLMGLGKTHLALGDLQASRTALERALSICQASWGATHPATLRATTALAETDLAAGNVPRADSLLQGTVSLGANYLPTSNATLAASRLALGKCLMAQSRFAEAEKMLEQAYEGFQGFEGAYSKRLENAKETLIELYETWQKPEMASRYR